MLNYDSDTIDKLCFNKVERVELFDQLHGKCRSVRKIPPSEKRPYREGFAWLVLRLF